MSSTDPSIARLFSGIAASLALVACATVDAPEPPAAESIQILALNDFHGNIEPPAGEVTWLDGGESRQGLLGGAARMAAVLERLREGRRNTITVAAGDMIGASPLTSAHFLDEPTIVALDLAGLELAAVGNHEFDRGPAELRRMQQGGCQKHTSRQPCALDHAFAGARFRFLAANVLDEAGRPFLPGAEIREFGAARIGFIGMTLKETGTLVSPAGVAGLRFADEAETANALAARLREQGADTVILLLHQGARVQPAFNANGCPGLSGPVVPILDRLDPVIRLVVSGHTHMAYICEMRAPDGSTRLLTSAGRYGNFVTDIRLTVDPASDRVTALDAVNRAVSEDAGEDTDVAALVRRYAEAIAPIASRIVGRVEGSLETAGGGDADPPLGRLIADAQLAATAASANGGAEIAFINSGGLRTRFAPAADGTVSYGQIFALQPFGNTLVVLELTGGQIVRLLEQQFTAESPARVRQSLLIPSAGLAFAYDRTRPVGERIVEATLNGEALTPDRRYRVTVNNFLASGGDGFSVLTEGRVVAEGGLDLDALESFIAAGARVAESRRIANLTPEPR